MISGFGIGLFVGIASGTAGETGNFLNDEVVVTVALIAICAAAVGDVADSLVAIRISENKLGELIGVVVLVMEMIVFIRNISLDRNSLDSFW